MSLKGIIVNGTTYHYDYEYLDNKPTIPDIPDYSNSDDGKVLTVVGASGSSIPAALTWQTPESGGGGGGNSLPTSDSSGYILTMDDSSSLRWVSPMDALPTAPTDTEGYILISAQSGTLRWKSFSDVMDEYNS